MEKSTNKFEIKSQLWGKHTIGDKLNVTDFHVQEGLHEPNLESHIGSHEPGVRIYIGLDNPRLWAMVLR